MGHVMPACCLSKICPTHPYNLVCTMYVCTYNYTIWPSLPLHHSAHTFMHPRLGSFGFIWFFTGSLTDFSLGTYLQKNEIMGHFTEDKSQTYE